MTTENTPKHIVAIDDDLDIQDLIIGYFKPKGFNVTVFSDAESAFNKLKMGLTCDVIITDLHLPKMSGFDLIQKLKVLQPDIPIILLTVTKSVETAVKAIHQGAYDFIVKPIPFSQLQISVERAMHFKNLQENYQSLRTIVNDKKNQPVTGIIGRSPGFVSAIDIAKRVARSNANIFINGESGTGKEVIAKFIHSESPKKNGPFIAINCSAIPENLLESELFGHAKGAFTGALEKKIGLFEEAENGTLFLDEIGDLSLSLQAKLLRVLQEKKIKRVGENQMRPFNARIISATHKNLQAEIAAGNFREDLFFRLNVIPIKIPPLRDRKEDIIPLSEFFLKRYSSLNNSSVKSFSKEALQRLMDLPWRGNVRELENTIERAVVMCSSEILKESDIYFDTEIFKKPEDFINTTELRKSGFYIDTQEKLLSLEDIVQKYISFAVEKNKGAKDVTAKELGIDRKTLYKRLQQANLDKLSKMEKMQ